MLQEIDWVWPKSGKLLVPIMTDQVYQKSQNLISFLVAFNMPQKGYNFASNQYVFSKSTEKFIFLEKNI